MHLTLEVKRYHEFFWLRDIQAVNIYKCCAECFIGNRDSMVYHGTLHQPPRAHRHRRERESQSGRVLPLRVERGIQLPPEHARGVHSRSG